MTASQAGHPTTGNHAQARHDLLEILEELLAPHDPDPRVLAHYDGDLTLANVHQPALEKLRARYPQRPGVQPATAPSLRSA